VEDRSRRVDRLLLMLLAVSLFINVAVVWWLVRPLRNSPGRRTVPDVTVGTRLDPIVGVSPNGEPTTITYGAAQQPIVLYVFSVRCEWCRRNIQAIAALAASAQARFRFVGVSLSSATESKDSSLSFPVVVPTGQVPFKSTPQTVVLARDGRVVRSWLGAYDGTTKVEIEEYFGTRLPDIRAGNKGD
jgi:hypothetical protein